jgi:hypothetical protein
MLYHFKNGDDLLLPVDDVTYFTDDMNGSYSTGIAVLEFFDADGVTVVTPTGGTVTFSSAPIGEQWHEPSNGTGVIDATTVGLTSSYVIPLFEGLSIKSRMVLSGVTGASFVRAYHWRH